MKETVRNGWQVNEKGIDGRRRTVISNQASHQLNDAMRLDPVHPVSPPPWDRMVTIIAAWLRSGKWKASTCRIFKLKLRQSRIVQVASAIVDTTATQALYGGTSPDPAGIENRLPTRRWLSTSHGGSLQCTASCARFPLPNPTVG